MSSNQRLAKRKVLAICIGLALTVSACDNDNKKPTKTNVEKITGIWERPGYGNAYVIKDNQTIEYEFTRAACLKLGTEAGIFGMTEKKLNEADIIFSGNDTKFSFLDKGDVFRVNFKRLSELPTHCQTSLVKNTPVETFKHFWNTFNDYYAFNTERGIDWSERYVAVISDISDDMSEEELFAALSKTISPLDDAHTGLESDNDDFSPEKIKGVRKFIVDLFESQTEISDLEVFSSTLLEQYLTIRDSYIDGEVKSEKQMTWGLTNEGVGFLQIDAMLEYAEGDDPDLEEDLEALNTLLDKVMSDLKDAPSMIIDIRLNGGGSDAISLAIAGRFTDQRLKVMSKTARSFSGDTPSLDAYIKPQGNAPYLKPVVIIAGSDTVSAAEIFVLAMSNLSQVTIIGKPTNGSLSDILSKELPNGWEFGLSNEVYLDQNGKSHEVIGIHPQTEVALFSVDDLENKRNSAIEAALKILGF